MKDRRDRKNSQGEKMDWRNRRTRDREKIEKRKRRGVKKGET